MTGSADGFSINRDDPGRDAGYRGDPGDEAALELLSVENGQDIPEMVVRRGAILEWAEAAKKRQFLGTEKGDLGETLGPGQHRQQAQEQDLIERVSHLTLLAGIMQIIEMT